MDLDNFFGRLKGRGMRALLLDYDGTLAPFQAERNRALPYPGIPEILHIILKAKHSRVVLISGRWTKDLIPLLGIEELPEIWGTHGMERLKPDGSYVIRELSDSARDLLDEVKKWAGEVGLRDACEQKPGAVAIHWRGKTFKQKKKIRKAVMDEWGIRTRNAGLSPEEFDGGIEFRVPGWNKGVAVETVLSEMNDNIVAAYLGDDLTDEDAFRSIKNRGLGVLVRGEFRPTAADLWLIPPHELLGFLWRWHEAAST